MGSRKFFYCYGCLNSIKEEVVECPLCGRKKPDGGWTIDEYMEKTVFGRVKITQRLGGGRTGAVYVGEDEETGEKIAIKFLHREWTQNEEVLNRFKIEALVSKTIDIPYIVKTFDFGTLKNGTYYITMEYIEGLELEDILKKYQKLNLEKSLVIISQVLAALAAAHSLNVIHRDIKAGNIFITMDENKKPLVKILDFGFAKLLSSGSQSSFIPVRRITKTPVILGSPSYMSPEQAKGEHSIDHRADIYATGILFFRLITGKVPFEDSDMLNVIKMQIEKKPLPPTKVIKDGSVPEKVDKIILKMLEKDPEKRFHSAGEVLQKLKETFPEYSYIFQNLKIMEKLEEKRFQLYENVGRYIEDSEKVIDIAKEIKPFSKIYILLIVAGFIIFLIILYFIIKSP